ncbi:kinase-like domain-containing protein [Penicillium hispanicum]|uniref:kinase-like domain-containing protein n=1 Tax=Penicillium hispanicum TaxID=1080232 RepID=UPI0025422B92|nr:kinase-like domain-containing protein [Penicillium hispanicum]KAJ5594829.1 kinase-like domain-containing protein [Penicillium hispanicum]
MSRLLCQFFKRPFLSRQASPVRHFTRSNIQLIDATNALEEETLPWYSQDLFYPVKIGEVFQSRYQVIGKLGFGGYSTVWLCRDLIGHQYVTLKVFERGSSEGKREVEVYDRLNACTASHDGAILVRKALDSFQINSAEGFYQCLIHQPLGISNRFRAKVLPEKLVKLTLIHLLLALDYLHSEAGIIHTDIQERNVLLGIDNMSVLTDFEEAEKSDPSPRKIVGNRVIYASRKLKKTNEHGRPVLCDFGQARLGSARHSGDIQPYIYRAPEVLLRMSWDQKVDIWNLGLVAWDLFQTGHLFYGRDARKQESDTHHLAEMIALLGPPPKNMIKSSEYATNFFNDEAKWNGAVPIPSITMEQLEGNLQGEQQQLFLEFMRKMLRWQPDERHSARDLLSDRWLRSS